MSGRLGSNHVSVEEIINIHSLIDFLDLLGYQARKGLILGELIPTPWLAHLE